MFKKYLPKTIFFRYLLIIIAPILFLQILLTIVFFDSLWMKTNKGLLKSVAGEINAVIEVYNNKQTKKISNL